MEGNESVDVDPPVAPQPVPVPLPAGTARVLGGEEITAALPIDVDEDAESSDGNWSSGSSFNEDSDDESILTYDTADDESINFVRPKAGRSEWTTSCYSDDKGPFSRPDGEGSWKMDPEASYSDYTLIVVSKETGKQRIYHVHKFTLAHGQCGCEYFAALFRTPCREIVERSSRFTFPTEITNVFPDFLDIVYNPGYMGNVSLFFRRFEGTLYGGNLLPLRGLALYFGCRCLLSNVGKKIKDNINDMHRYNSGGLWATTKLVAALCEDETAEDSQELLGHIVRALVRCFDQFAFNRNKEVLSSIVEAMSPEVLLSLLLQATSTLTNRYRIYACGASIPFTTIVIEYLNANPAITTWQFERIVLYLLDFLQPGFDAIAKIGKELVACGHKRGMYTDFVKRSLKGYVEPSSETVGRLNKVVKTLESTSPHELYPLKIIIEGKYGGNQCSAAVQYGGAELGGNQGNPAFISTQSVPYFTLDDLKSLVYLKTGLRPNLQRIEYENENGDMILLRATDTLESIGAFSGEASLYLHAIPYCPPSLST